MNLYFQREVQPNIQLTSTVNGSDDVFYLILMTTEAAGSPEVSYASIKSYSITCQQTAICTVITKRTSNLTSKRSITIQN
jgi:hypothetical protein